MRDLIRTTGLTVRKTGFAVLLWVAAWPLRASAAGSTRWRRWAAAFLLVELTAGWAASSPQSAAAERPSPDEVEAAYLYNFGKFVRWPGVPAQQPLAICIAGDDAMSQVAARLTTGESIDGRPLEVKRLDGPAEAAGCSILFVGGSERERQDEYLAGVAGKPVLTVGDGPDFLVHGGMIQFQLTRRHVRFSVNLNAARHSSLQLSSELLKVAVKVVGRPGGQP